LAALRNRGSYFTIGYGGNVDLRTIELISREINVVGNLVGSYNDLAELMPLTAQGKVTLHTNTYSLDAVNDANPASSSAAEFSFPPRGSSPSIWVSFEMLPNPRPDRSHVCS
jgi:D-arabinose 1-dehydrogenase-like Zn-dependent alcohol dehydrogenase